MHNELTKKDIQMMKEELDYRRIQLRPQLLDAVKEARAFGDLSENFEYKAAKQEKNRNESRIRFLENMIKTAVVLPDAGASDGVQLYDRVTVFLEDEGDTEVYQVVTTMRQDALHGLISKESPLGKALLGRKVGETFHIQVNDTYGYAAASTIIAVFENIITFAMELTGCSRRKSVICNLIAILVLSVPCILGFNVWSGISPLGAGKNILDFEDFLVSNNLLPIGSLVYLLFCTSCYGWGWKKFTKEANSGQGIRFPKWARVYVSYILPLIVLFIFVQGYITMF